MNACFRSNRGAGRIRMRLGLTLAAMVLGAWAWVSCTTTLKPVVYPGKQVRTRVLSVKETPAISVHLESSPDDRVRLQVMDVRLRTVVEVPVYEKVIQYIDEHSDSPLPVRQEVVPGEFLEGKPRSRNEHAVPGPLAHAEILVNGTRAVTDARGRYVDAAGRILALFDPPGIKQATVTVAAPPRRSALLRITRRALLDALGVDERIGPAGPHRRLRFRVECPKKAAPGSDFEIAVTAENLEKSPVWAVQARSFSRHGWLGGRNFYFGRIAAESRRRFRRRIHVPAAAEPGVYYAAIGFWDWLGPLPERAVPLAVRIAAPAGRER